MQTIEDKLRRRADVLGYAIGVQHSNGRASSIVYDPENPSEVFATAADYFGLLPFLWRAPSIKGRRPRPTVEDLTRAIAREKGYDVVARPSGGIAVVDPTAPDRIVAVRPFWMETLSAVLGLRSVAPRHRATSNNKPSPAVASPAPPFPRRTGRVVGEEVQLELEVLTDEQRQELEAQRESECAACGGRVPGGCPECMPVGTFDDENPPPRVL